MNSTANTAKNPGHGKPGRNDPCPCGSGRKYKVCCGISTDPGSVAGVRTPPPAPANSRALKASLERAAHARNAGQPMQAAAALRQAISLDPGNPAPVMDLGDLLLSVGRLPDALSCFERVLALQPVSARAHFSRGVALEKLGRHSEAAAAFQQTVKLAPRNAEAHAHLGVIMRTLQRKAEAAESFHKAATLSPNTILGRMWEAYALMAEDKAELAEAALRRVIALEPRNASAHTALGKVLAELGKAPEARAAFEQAIRLDPRAAGLYYDLARIGRLSEADRPLLQRMLTAAERSELSDTQRIMLEIAIGKAYDDLGDAQRAMQHYVASAGLKSRLRPLDRGMIEQRVDWALRTFSAEFLARNADVGLADETPILVLGMPRSGTTLVESILACHSQVGAGQELLFWGGHAKQIAATGIMPGSDALRDLGDQYLEVLRDISRAPRVTDKKPENFFWVGLIHLVFPQARIIHCRRNPLDTCVSILSNYFAPRPDFSSEPSDLVFYYRAYERMMAHWRAVLPPDRFLEIDYESLVAEPEPAVRRLLGFCGLGWEEACLHPEENARLVNTASLWQVRQPISTASVGRWRRYEPWLGTLAELAREKPL